ncbi:MAG: CPBP family intramembrane glutamic endopeptidase [Sphingomonas sp.]
MIFGPVDHLYVAIGLGLIVPIGGWWDYRLFLRRVEAQGDAALVGEYRYTLLWLLGIGFGALGVWLWAGRPLAALGFALPAEGSAAAAAITVALIIGLLLRNLFAAVSAGFAQALRAHMGDIEPYLPKTKEQLGWGLAVSVFAGVFEEIAYRGFLIAYFEASIGLWGALAASSLLFGLSHLYQGWQGVVGTSLIGVGLGWLYLASGSLLLPMVAHTAIDISSMVAAWMVLRPGAKASPSAPGRS